MNEDCKTICEENGPDGVVIDGNVADIEDIEPIDEHEEYEDGTEIIYKELMGRIETLENRINRLIIAIDKSKTVRGI